MILVMLAISRFSSAFWAYSTRPLSCSIKTADAAEVPRAPARPVSRTGSKRAQSTLRKQRVDIGRLPLSEEYPQCPPQSPPPIIQCLAACRFRRESVPRKRDRRFRGTHILPPNRPSDHIRLFRL